MAEVKTAQTHGDPIDRNVAGDNTSFTPTNGTAGYHGSGGTMNRFITPGGHPLDNSQPAFPVYHRKFANPAPLGLLSFAATTFFLSLLNVYARGITVHNVILGMALGYGGLAQVVAGILEWACGNTFGATAFFTYGSFWISFSIFYIPQFEVFAAYTNPRMLQNAIGLYLVTWALVTLIFLLASLRSSFTLVAVFFFLEITFWLLAAGYLAPSINAVKAGGAFGIVTAAFAAYTALAGMLTKDTSYFILPVGDLSQRT
nr:membrane protein [Cryptococcus depauperatus CBS 7855]